MEVAIALASESLTLAQGPDECGVAFNDLGTALQTLGERESGTARLEAVVRAYEAALEERTRDRVPLQWAMTQNNLGAVLYALGARQSGMARLRRSRPARTTSIARRTSR